MNDRPELHTFMFADISGYAAIAERSGDEAAAEVALSFFATVSALAERHGVEVVKCLGDGVMAHSDDADRMVAFGLDLLDECERELSLPPIHVGIHTGSALKRANDWWGATVNLAARIGCAAGAGTLLVTEATRAAGADRAPASLQRLGWLRLKNISTPVRVYAASRAEPGLVATAAAS